MLGDTGSNLHRRPGRPVGRARAGHHGPGDRSRRGAGDHDLWGVSVNLRARGAGSAAPAARLVRQTCMSPDSAPKTRFIFVTGGVVSSLGKGIAAASIGRLLVARGPERPAPEVRPVHQRRPGHDVAVPARRGLRDRGRRGDRPRPRPLRALHRLQHEPRLQRHRRRGLQHGDPPRAPRRLPGRDRPGRPAHHRRDQAAHPRRRRGERRRRRDHRDRRHGRRHRVAALPRGDPPVPRRRGAGPLHVHPPHARALHRPRGRAEDQAHPALGQRAAPHRHRARHGRLPLRGQPRHRHPAQDRPVRLAARGGGRLRARRGQHLQGAARLPRGGRRRLRARALPHRGRRARPRRLARSDDAARTRPSSRCGSRSSGKYVRLEDAYLSVVEALRHSGFMHGGRVEIDWVDSEKLDPAEARRAPGRGGRDPHPRRLRRAGDRGQDRRRPHRARERHPLPGHLPRHAARRLRVRAPRHGDGGRELDRVRSRDAVRGHRPAARAEGGGGHGRDDAPGRRPDQAARRHPRPRDLRARPSSTSVTATATRSTTSCASAWRRPEWCSPAPRRTTGSSR